jgi:argininosuccinate lyase
MPQKKNPDPLELTRAKAAIITGKLVAVLGITKGLPSGYSRDLQDLKPQLLEASSAAIDTVRVMDGVVRTLQVRKGKMSKVSKNSYAIALDVAEQLVAKKGVPFRSAHKIVGALVGRAAEKDVALSKLDAKEISVVLKKAGTKVAAAELAKIVQEMTPERSIELRRSAGSPNPKEQDEMIKAGRSKMTGFDQGVQKRAKFVKGSLDGLAKTVDSYLSS